MATHSDCISYEVLEGANGAIADRIVWSSKDGARRGNLAYAQTDLARDMQRIVTSYTSFFGVPIAVTTTGETTRRAHHDVPADASLDRRPEFL
jgi:hypothetical protein